MWYGKPTLKDVFEKFKKKPNYTNAEELINEAEKRKIIVDRVAKKYRAIDKIKIAMEIEDMIRNKLIGIEGLTKSFKAGHIPYDNIIADIEEAVDEYENIFELFDKKLKKHILEIKIKLKKEYEILTLEEAAV